MALQRRSPAIRPPGPAARRILASTAPHPPAPGRPRLVLLAGLPGSGKSTLGRQLAARAPLTVLESDAVRKLLVPSPQYTPREHALVFASLRSAALAILRGGGSVLIDATNLTERERRPFSVLAEQAGVPIIVVWVTAPESVHLHRLAAPQPDPFRRSDATPEVYQQMKPTVRLPRRPFILVDTSRDITLAVERIVETLHEP